MDLNNSTKKFIYFETLKGLQNSSSSIAKDFFKLAGQSLGMGVGMLYGVNIPYVMSLYENEHYILIYDFSNQNYL